MQFRLYIAAADGIMHARCDHICQFRYRLSGLRNLIGRLADTWDACIRKYAARLKQVHQNRQSGSSTLAER